MRVILLNGSKAERVKNSEGCTILSCGCAHLEREWIQMCETHHAEHEARHQLAQQQHQEKFSGNT
jgi:hypothetical protein